MFLLVPDKRPLIGCCCWSVLSQKQMFNYLINLEPVLHNVIPIIQTTVSKSLKATPLTPESKFLSISDKYPVTVQYVNIYIIILLHMLYISAVSLDVLLMVWCC